MPMRFSRAVVVALVGLASFSAVCTLSAQSTKAAPPSKTASALGAAQQKAATAKLLIDINRAASGDLEALPGIGKALSAKIIGGRPYANKQQLVQRGILTQAVYDKVKDRIIAKQ